MSKAKLCKNCKFIKKDWSYGILTLFVGSGHIEYAECRHPNSLQELTASQLVGVKEKKKEYNMCVVQRAFDKNCGKIGKWWEPKP